MELATTSRLEALLREEATRLGFDAVAITDASTVAGLGEALDAFVAAGYHGDMAWMADTARRRSSPRAMWPDAVSAVMVSINYGPDIDPLERLKQCDRGVVSVYAQGSDYHDVVKKRLKALGRWFHAQSGAEVKVFVDTAPLMEKPLAQRAGLGWQGKHTNLVSRAHGSWLFLGALLTTAKLTPDDPEPDHCGSCRACLDICPTRAFPAPYRLDARRCISYLTIEHKGHIPVEFRKAIGNRIYGCDDCLAVCPWNKFAASAREAKLRPREELRAPPLADLVKLDETAFRALFSGSPIKRIKRERFIRNVLIAVGNSGEARLASEAERLLGDASPLVRAMAVWALAQLLDTSAFARLRHQNLPGEADGDVRAEWRAGMGEAS